MDTVGVNVWAFLTMSMQEQLDVFDQLGYIGPGKTVIWVYSLVLTPPRLGSGLLCVDIAFQESTFSWLDDLYQEANVTYGTFASYGDTSYMTILLTTAVAAPYGHDVGMLYAHALAEVLSNSTKYPNPDDGWSIYRGLDTVYQGRKR